MKNEKVYEFVGEGAGIPGLPHQVTKEEAKNRKVGELLEIAIKKGVYAEKKSEIKTEPGRTEPVEKLKKE